MFKNEKKIFPVVKKRSKAKKTGGEMAGTRLKTAMIAAGYTNAKLAARLNVSIQIVRLWLRQKECRMSSKHLVGIAKALQVRPSWLVTGEGPPGRLLAVEYSEPCLLRMYRGLDAPLQKILIDIAHRLTREL